MSILSMRPTFTTEIPLPLELVATRLAKSLSEPQREATSLIFDRYYELHIPGSEMRYWSPHLSLTLEGDTHRTVVVGRFAPRQNVWTLVWIVYLALAFSLFFSLIYVYSHWILGSSTWVTLTIPASIIGIVMLYISSHVGQSWSFDQMTALRVQWEEIAAEISAVSLGEDPESNSNTSTNHVVN